MLGMYQSAADEFSKIPGYADSGSWKYYCLGMADIETANDSERAGYISDAISRIESASRYFDLLAGIGFENSEALKQYCSARNYQLKGLTQTALDIYASLLGVLDSGERYWSIVEGTPMATQAPIQSHPPLFTPIAAHANRKTAIYFGPGDNYLTQEITSINADTKLSICAREGSYYLVEIKISSGKLRAWAPTIRITRDEDKTEVKIGEKPQNAKVINDAEALLGPGQDYLRSGYTLKKGTAVVAYESEGLYTMIQYKDTKRGKLVRLWLLTGNLSVSK